MRRQHTQAYIHTYTYICMGMCVCACAHAARKHTGITGAECCMTDSTDSSRVCTACAFTHLPTHPALSPTNNTNKWTSKVAYGIAQTLRFGFDLLAGFKTRRATEAMYLNRVVFLETVAGIPGMCAGMIRHMHSLRRMKRDHGWIHTLLEGGDGGVGGCLRGLGVRGVGRCQSNDGCSSGGGCC